MKRHIALIFSAMMIAAPLSAQDISAQIVDQLRAQGYEQINVSKTWLGRLRIDANAEGQRREIIVNPRTGEILRDFLASTEVREPAGVQILDRPAPRPARERSAPGGVGGQRGPEGLGGRDGGGAGGSGGPSR